MLEKADTQLSLVQRLLSELGFFLGKLGNVVDTWAHAGR